MSKSKKGSIKAQMLKIIFLGITLPTIILLVISALKFENFEKNEAKLEALSYANKYAQEIYKKLFKTFAAIDYFAEIQSATITEEGIIGLTVKEVHSISKKIVEYNQYVLDIYNNYLPGRIYLEETGSLNKNLVLFGEVKKKNKFSSVHYLNYKFKSNVIDSLKAGNGYLLLPPYYDVIDGDTILMITYGHAIMYNNEIAGLSGTDIAIDWIQDYVSSTSLFENKANITIITGKGIIIGDSKNSKLVGKNINEVYTSNSDLNLLNYKEEKIIDEPELLKFYVPISFETLKDPLFVRISAPKKAVLKNSIYDLLKKFSYALAILIISISISYYYSRGLISRISNLANITKKISKGHLNIEFTDKGNDEIRELNDSLNAMTKRFTNILGSIKATTDKLYISSTDLSEVAVKLSEGASEQASSTEEVSASMEQMTAIIDQNAENAKIADNIAQKSADGITVSRKNVVQTTKSMGEIANKTSIIGDIAFQTNILALNAAVEAARAGIHGKGFGVVAAEVGKLAENSKKAADEIDDLTQKSFAIAKKSGELLEQIAPDIKKTAQLVQEITNASIEQKAGTEQINNAIQQLNNVTQENAGSAELLATNVEVLNALADKLGKLTAFFKLEKTEKKKGRSAEKKEKPAIEIKNTGIKNEKTEIPDTDNIIEIKEKVKEETKNIKQKIKTEKNSIKTKNGSNLSSPKGFKLNLDDEDNDDEFEKF